MTRVALIGLILLACALVAWLASGSIETDRAAPTPDHAVSIEGSTVEASPTAIRRAAVAGAVPDEGRDVAPEDEVAPPPGPPLSEEPPLPGEEEIWEEVDFDATELLAAIGLPPDAPRALLIDRVGPPDPLEIGEASLFLELFDAATGEAVSSPVTLWRIDAPGNEYWRRGDQAVSHKRVMPGGRTFTQLAAGRYRMICHAERLGAQHSPAFHVAGDTEEEVFLDLPSERPVRLDLKANDERVERAELLVGPLRAQSIGPSAPPWVRQRVLRDPPDVLVLTDEEISSDGDTPRSWVRMQAGPDGFDLGMFPEDRRDTRYSRIVQARTGGSPRDERHLGCTLTLRNESAGELLRLSGVLTAR